MQLIKGFLQAIWEFDVYSCLYSLDYLQLVCEKTTVCKITDIQDVNLSAKEKYTSDPFILCQRTAKNVYPGVRKEYVSFFVFLDKLAISNCAIAYHIIASCREYISFSFLRLPY
jgi:hypothetical protein